MNMNCKDKPKARFINGQLCLVSKPPKYCAADRDGDCSHKGCPQLLNWKPICTIPDWPEDD